MEPNETVTPPAEEPSRGDKAAKLAMGQLVRELTEVLGMPMGTPEDPSSPQ